MIEPRSFKRILLIEDNTSIREGLARLARGWGAEVLEAGTVATALELLSPPPDLIIADVRLPDGSAQAVFKAAASAWPRPTIVAISGQASAAEAFLLGQMGVRAYLPKPLTLAALTSAVAEARSKPPDLAPFIAESVGRSGLRQINETIGQVMLRQAMAISNGSRSRAARLLDVSRQAVQQRLQGRAKASEARPPTPDEDQQISR